MATKQGKLFNTSTMTSTRVMKALKRQERLDQLPKLVRKPRDVTPAIPWRQDPENEQFHLPDESRIFPVHGVKKCWICGSHAELIRQHFHGEGMKYRVRCLEFPHCPNETISFNKSTGAVRAWQLAAGLSQV